MDDLTFEDWFEAEVRNEMRLQAISREEAIVQVSLRVGEVDGTGDLVCLYPLTPDQRRRIGLDHDPLKLIEEARKRLARERADQLADADVEEQRGSVIAADAPRR